MNSGQFYIEWHKKCYILKSKILLMRIEYIFIKFSHIKMYKNFKQKIIF
jgi:hypothetical protein